MNLYLLGIDEDLCTWDEDGNPQGIRCVLPDGWRYLSDTNRLLDVISPDKGRALHRLSSEDLAEGEDGLLILNRQALRKLLNILEGIEQEAERDFTAHWHVRPEKLAWLQERAPDLLEDSIDDAGRPVKSLSGTIAGAIIARNFLENAWRLGCDVAVD